MAIMNVNDYLFKGVVNLTGTDLTTGKLGEVVKANGEPYKSSYGKGATIIEGTHPFNGVPLRLSAEVVNVLPATADDATVSIELYTNDVTVTAITDTCGKLVATYGPFKAKDIIHVNGHILDTMLPQNLGTALQVKVKGSAAFDKVNTDQSPMLQVLLEVVNG